MRKFILILSWLLLLTLPAYAQDTEPNAQVKAMSATLNLRAAPVAGAAVIVELAGGTPLIVQGRTADSFWLKVRTLDAQEGWVAAGYVDLNGDIASFPVLTADAPVVTDATPVATAAPEIAPGGDAFVKALALNLRAAPSTRGAILVQLPNKTPLTLLARNATNTWLKVDAAGQQGWVAASYVQINVDLSTIPVEAATTAPGGTTDTGVGTGAGAPVSAGNVITNITSTARTIYQRGKSLGNRANVFSKVGDSISVAADMYDPLGRGIYNLGGYGYLQSVINFYLDGQNSFTNVSAAAGPGWTTESVLNPALANSAICLDGETPLNCEYRINKPAVALIMLGSNDVHYFDAGTYQYYLQQIVQITKDAGIIPVLSTIPVRIGYEEKVIQFNGVIRGVAAANGIPLWDYAGAMAGLPNSGLSGDGLHPSTSPAGYQGAADFNGENLQYGYVIRNLTMLQVLDALWRQVLAG